MSLFFFPLPTSNCLIKSIKPTKAALKQIVSGPGDIDAKVKTMKQPTNDQD